jgi:cell division protein FtsB
MVTLTLYKVMSVLLLISLIGTSGAAVYYYREQGMQQRTIFQNADLQDSYKARIADLTNQISSLNNQIGALNSQIVQLQALNAQLGGNNAQLISEIQQLQTQVDQMEAQVSDLLQTLSLQKSRVIASQVTVDRQSFTVPSGYPTAIISLTGITYSGYLRVTWTSAARMSFGLHVFDVNVTTPFTASGVYSVPVSANATGNAWFQCLDYYFVNGVNVCIDEVTYGMTYWY